MTVLRGPADADHYRVKVGRYGDRWYTDPLPACDLAPASDWHGPSVSATKPPFANKYVPMRAIADMPDAEWERLATVEADARYEAIKTHEKVAGRVNMDRGTIVHLWAEDLLHGRQQLTDAIGFSTAATEQAKKFRASLEAFFAAHNPILRFAEVVCLNRNLNGVGYGGTADAFVEIDGELWAVDWKSRNSDHGAYPDEAGQGGAYIGAEYMIVTGPDGEPQRAPIPKFAGVLIVSIREDGFRAYPIDAAGAVAHYEAMHSWWVAQQNLTKNKVIGRPWAPKGEAPKAESVAPVDVDNLRSRIAAVIAAGHEHDMRIAWPAGVPTLSTGGHTLDQLRALDDAVARIEARHEMPFQPSPPAATPQASEPSPSPKPAAPPPDDGAPVDAATLDALRKRVDALPAEARARLAEITQEAHAAGRSLNVKLHPKVRVWEIARALVLWAETGADVELLELHVAETATAEQCAEPTTGAALSLFTIDQATRLADALQRATTAATAA